MEESIEKWLQEQVEGFEFSDISNLDVLQQYAREDVELSSHREGAYRFEPLKIEALPLHGEATGYAEGWSNRDGDIELEDGSREIYRIFLDGPAGFGLFYKDKPQAAVSMDFCINKLQIKQIQGVMGDLIDSDGNNIKKIHSRGLAPLDWRKLMVDEAERFAKYIGEEEMSIQSAVNNDYANPVVQNPNNYVPVEVLRKKYDDVAQRLGYELDWNANWRKEI